MRSEVLLEILNGIDNLAIDEAAKREVRCLVNTVGWEHGVRRITCASRVEFARRLLDLKVSRTTIKDRLKAAFGISKEQAYRDIRAALKLCQESRQIATENDQTKASNGESSLLTVPDGG